MLDKPDHAHHGTTHVCIHGNRPALCHLQALLYGGFVRKLQEIRFVEDMFRIKAETIIIRLMALNDVEKEPNRSILLTTCNKVTIYS